MATPAVAAKHSEFLLVGSGRNLLSAQFLLEKQTKQKSERLLLVDHGRNPLPERFLLIEKTRNKLFGTFQLLDALRNILLDQFRLVDIRNIYCKNNSMLWAGPRYYFRSDKSIGVCCTKR